LRKYSTAASLPLLAHPHMLRHVCGFALADQGADTRLIQDYLGHLEHSAHRQVHRDQSGQVREALALRSPRPLMFAASLVVRYHGFK
jgi:site-specific recombinase XerD